MAAENGNYTALNQRATAFERGGSFDELVIVDGRNWYLGIGDFNLRVRAGNGALEVKLYDGQTTSFSDERGRNENRLT